MSDIFISYARSTQPQAELIDDALTSLGYSVWRDRELPLHRRYPQVLEERLREARAVVVMWSKDALASDWVRSEAELARQEDKLVQVSVDRSAPPMPFNQIQCGDLAGWTGDLQAPSWLKLVSSLSDLVPTTSPRGARVKVSREPLLAVLPFDNLSGDADLLYFSDGVSEEILQTVAQSTGLKVIGRSSSFQFRGVDKGARRVAAELNCSHLLDGSVRRSGPRVRISASLVECAGQTTIWTGRFDRDLSDVFALQDEIGAAVAVALKATFEPSLNAGPIDPRAYDLYLRARTQSPGREGTFNVGLLREAVARAPKFAQAWAVLAYALASQARYAGDPEVFALQGEARQAAEQALVLDPAAGLAHAALGYLHAPCGEYAAWEASVDKALQAAPHDPVVLYQASLARYWVGRPREALAFIEHVIELDPLYAQGANWRALMLDATGHDAEARAAYRAARDRWPEFEFLFLNASGFAARQGDWGWVDEMAADMRRLGIDTPLVRRAARAADLLLRRGPASRAEAVRALEGDLAATGSLPPTSLVLAADLGAIDDVYSAVERASFAHFFRPGAHLPSREISIHVLFSRQAAPLRADARFVTLCDKLGLADYWLSTGRWPDFAEEVASLYDLKAKCERLTGTAATGEFV